MNKHWNARLKDVADIERKGIDPSDIVEGTTYVGLEHIASGGESLSSARVSAGELGSTKFQFTRDHVLYGKLRPYLAKIVAPDFDGVCSTDILPIRPGPQVDKRYLLHFLRLPTNVAWAAGRATGVNLPRLSPSELADLSMPLPPLDEQRRIAAILDKADAMRQKRKRAIALLKSMTISLFERHYASTAGRRALVQLSSLAQPGRATFSNGPFGSDLLASELKSSGVPVIYIRDIRDGEYDRVSAACVSEDKARQLGAAAIQEGDVLVAKVGDPPGVTAIYPLGEPPGIVTQDVVRIRLDEAKAAPLYLVALLNSSYGRHLIRGITVQATRARFALGDLKKLEVGLPSISEQRVVSDQLRSLQLAVQLHLDGLSGANDLFLSLQHRAFSGQL